MSSKGRTFLSRTEAALGDRICELQMLPGCNPWPLRETCNETDVAGFFLLQSLLLGLKGAF